MTVGASAFGMPGGGASSGMIHLSGGGGEPTPAPRKWLTQAVHHINTTARPSRCGEATIRGRTNTSLQMAFRSLARRSPLGSGTCASVGFGVQTAAPNAAPSAPPGACLAVGTAGPPAQLHLAATSKPSQCTANASATPGHTIFRIKSLARRHASRPATLRRLSRVVSRRAADAGVAARWARASALRASCLHAGAARRKRSPRARFPSRCSRFACNGCRLALRRHRAACTEAPQLGVSADCARFDSPAVATRQNSELELNLRPSLARDAVETVAHAVLPLQLCGDGVLCVPRRNDWCHCDGHYTGVG